MTSHSYRLTRIPKPDILNACKEKAKEPQSSIAKYGDRFLYQYATITDDTTIEQMINAVVIDARRIIDAYKQK